MQVFSLYITWPKQFKSWKVLTVVSNRELIGALTDCALLHSVCDLKAAQMNMQYGLIWKLMIYKYVLGNNTAELSKTQEPNDNKYFRNEWDSSSLDTLLLHSLGLS